MKVVLYARDSNPRREEQGRDEYGAVEPQKLKLTPHLDGVLDQEGDKGHPCEAERRVARRKGEYTIWQARF